MRFMQHKGHPQWVYSMAKLLVMVQKDLVEWDFMVMKEFDKQAEERAWEREEKNDTHWAIQPPHGGDAELEMLDATLVQAVGTAWTIMWSSARTYNATYDDRRMRPGRSSNASMEKSAEESMWNRVRYKNGVRFYVANNGDWLDSSEPPVTPCKKCLGKAFHWFFECPQLQKTMTIGRRACAEKHWSTVFRCRRRHGLAHYPLPMTEESARIRWPWRVGNWGWWH